MWTWLSTPGYRKPAVVDLDAIFPGQLFLEKNPKNLSDSFQRH